MEIKGDQIWHSPSPAELLAAAGQEITLKACVHNIRELGGIAFVVLRTGRYLIQSVYDKEVCPDNNLSQLSAGDCVRATGLLRAEPRAERLGAAAPRLHRSVPSGFAAAAEPSR